MRKIFTFFLLCGICSGAFAYETGNNLLEDLRSTEPVRAVASMQFISGVSLGFQASERIFTGSVDSFCLPNRGSTLGQMKDITQKFLEDKPSERHSSAAVLVIRALRDAFPCQK